MVMRSLAANLPTLPRWQLSSRPEQGTDCQILVDQGPVDAITGVCEFRSTSLLQRGAGKALGTPFPRNRHWPAFRNHNESLGRRLDCLCQNRLRLTLHDPLRNAPARQPRAGRNAQRLSGALRGANAACSCTQNPQRYRNGLAAANTCNPHLPSPHARASAHCPRSRRNGTANPGHRESWALVPNPIIGVESPNPGSFTTFLISVC